VGSTPQPPYQLHFPFEEVADPVPTSLRVSQNVGKFLSSCTTGGFSRSSLLGLLFYSGMEALTCSDTRVNFCQTVRRHNSHESTAILMKLFTKSPQNSKFWKRPSNAENPKHISMFLPVCFTAQPVSAIATRYLKVMSTLLVFVDIPKIWSAKWFRDVSSAVAYIRKQIYGSYIMSISDYGNL
jgi:hypothetical protein